VGYPAAKELAVFTDPGDAFGGGLDEHLLCCTGGKQFSMRMRC
jgi:hypothetical protein